MVKKQYLVLDKLKHRSSVCRPVMLLFSYLGCMCQSFQADI